MSTHNSEDGKSIGDAEERSPVAVEQPPQKEVQVCRFCHEEAPVSELITTCLCPNIQSKVHRACIEDYLEASGARFCPICKFPYTIRYVRRYSLGEGILIYNERDLKMIWFRLLALVVVILVTIPLIAFSIVQLLAIGQEKPDDWNNSLFSITFRTFGYYTLLVGCLYVAICTIIVMLLDPLYSFFSWWNAVTKIRFGPMTKFNF